MAKPPRGLTAEEAALWARLAASVTPLEPRRAVAQAPLITHAAKTPVRVIGKKQKGRVPDPVVPPRPALLPPSSLASHDKGLDSHWERRLSRAAVEPDFTLDLHGHTLEQAHRRLDTGIMQAKACGARLVLLITGKPRPADAADRGERRGAIRAKIIDWLAAGPHGADISAIRKAHRRHGGDGALYIVLRRRG